MTAVTDGLTQARAEDAGRLEPLVRTPVLPGTPVLPALLPTRRGASSALRWAGFAAWSLARLATRGCPKDFFYFFGGIGDEVLLTAVFREWVRRGRPPVTMMTRYPALLQNNPDVRGTLAPDIKLAMLAKRLRRGAISPTYALPYESAEDRHPAPPYPIIARMCESVGLTGQVALRPYVHLTESEKAAGRLAPRQVAIMSAGSAAEHPITNKQWYPERFQALVDTLRGRFDFVQLGLPGDPPLSGALDLRGRTSLRESAAVLNQSLAFVGQIGLLMHLARAVDCRSVIVYGGREHPYQSGYGCNENLYTPLPCSPCWKLNSCDFDRECMRRITPQMVSAALERAAARAGEILETDTYTINGKRDIAGAGG